MKYALKYYIIFIFIYSFIELVGIHCTHGVNRTGYLLSRYLIEYLNFEPEKAIEGISLISIDSVIDDTLKNNYYILLS